MKATARTSALFTGLMTLATSAFAAGSAAQGSGILVWLFLGFCGLIVAMQLVPAAMLLIGIFRGVTTSSEAVPQTTK
jgi:ABC-type multidrug transport system permease subunit